MKKPVLSRRSFLRTATMTAFNPMGMVDAMMAVPPEVGQAAVSVGLGAVAPGVSPYIVGKTLDAMGLSFESSIRLGIYGTATLLKGNNTALWSEASPDDGYDAIYSAQIRDSQHLYDALSTFENHGDDETFVEKNKRALLDTTANYYTQRLSGLMYCYQMKDEVLQAVGSQDKWKKGCQEFGGTPNVVQTDYYDQAIILNDIAGATEEMLDFLGYIDERMPVNDEAFEDIHDSFLYVLDHVSNSSTRHGLEVLQSEQDDRKDPNGICTLPRCNQVGILLEMMYAQQMGTPLDVFPVPKVVKTVLGQVYATAQNDKLECDSTHEAYVDPEEQGRRWDRLRKKLDEMIPNPLPDPVETARLINAVRSSVRPLEEGVRGVVSQLFGDAIVPTGGGDCDCDTEAARLEHNPASSFTGFVRPQPATEQHPVAGEGPEYPP